MALPIPDQVVVVTGASSGIGRETALAFARAGAAVVGAARSGAALDSLRQEAADFGGHIETVVADVSIFGDVESIAAHAIERFGRIDTWVNNAGVTVYGRLDDLEPDELARVVAVDLLGAMYGSKVALAEMSRRGAGTIINIGSVLSERGVQLQAPYVASKHGIAGFTEALRLEVRETAAEIDVVLILPSSINTPFFEHARSKIGELPAPIPPVYQPHAVAKAILHAAEHGGRDIVVGGAGKMLIVNDRIASALMDRVMTTTGLMSRMQRARRPDDAADNLFEPSRGSGSTTGEFGDGAIATSIYTNQLELHPMRKRAAVGLALIGGLLLMRRMST